MSTVESRSINYATAINEALREEMRRDQTVLLMGEDIGAFGGVFKVTEGLQAEFGADRVMDAPISEAGIAGLGVGAAMAGSRPVIEIMFGDFLFLAMDQLVNQAAKVRYMSGGAWGVPLVVRTTLGAGRRTAAQHSQSLHAMLAHFPGLKVVLPSNAYDAKGMLKSAIRDPDPVLVFEHKLLYRERAIVPLGDYLVPLGVANVVRPGADLTILALARMVSVAVEAATRLAERNIDAEVIDLRTLAPLDVRTLVTSVQKTGRCVIVDEGHLSFGATAEIAAIVGHEAFTQLRAPIERVASLDVPVPFSPALEDVAVPDADKVVRAALVVIG